MALLSIRVPSEIGSLLAQVPVPGTKEQKDTLHITLVYLGDDVPMERVAQAALACFGVAETTRPFTVSTKLVTTFEGKEGEIPVICRVESDALHAFQKRLCEAFDAAGIEYSKKFPEYKPHITLSYAPERPADKAIPEVSFTVSDFVLWAGDDGENKMVVKLPLTMQAATSLTAARVAARHQVAKDTAQVKQVGALIEAVAEPLMALTFGYRSFNLKEEERNAHAKKLNAAAKALINGFKVTFEDPKLDATVKKKFIRLKNFIKLVTEYTKADTWAELEPIVNKQQTKTQSAYEKFREYAREAVGLIAHFDVEQEMTLNITDYSVTLWSSPRGDWSPDLIESVKWVLREANQTLASRGFAAIARGRVFAYPSATLPGSVRFGHSVLAAYRPSDDMMWLAAGGEPRKVLKSFIHEMGHRAYYKLVGSGGRNEWESFFEQNSGAPDVDRILRDWEQWQASDDYDAKKYGKYLAYFLNYLLKKDPEEAEWLKILADKLNITEELNNFTGAPKPSTVPGYDQLLAKKQEAKVFLHPVTAYSATNPSELFAETFAYYCTLGGQAIPEIVRTKFREVLPQFKGAGER